MKMHSKLHRALTVGLGLLTLLAWGMAAPKRVAAQTNGSITVIPCIGPQTFSPSWSKFLRNALIGIAAMTAGKGPGEPSPADWKPITNGTTSVNWVLQTPFNSWGGIANPPAPFANDFGNALFFSVVIKSPTPFSFPDITYNIKNNGKDLFTGTYSSNTLDNKGVMLSYGPDNTKGTTDDVWYSTGNPTGNELYLVQGIGFATLPQSGISNQDAIQNTFSSFTDSNPYGLRIDGTYVLNGLTGSSEILITGIPVLPLKPLPILNPALTNGALAFQIGCTNGQWLAVECTTNLSSTNWVSVYVTNNAPAGMRFTEPGVSTNRQRFYRARTWP